MLRFKSAPLLAALLLLLSSRAAAADGPTRHDARCAELPANIQTTDLLRPVMAALVHQSPTIRRQCAAIAGASRVRVTIRHVMRRFDRCARAEATVRRFATGEIEATIEIPFGPDYAELLAHELEHVLEQMDGLDLKRASRTRASGVAEVAPNVFETQRAKDAGLAARREARVRRTPRAFDGGASDLPTRAAAFD